MAGIERGHDGGGDAVPATVSKMATDAVGRRALALEADVLGRLAHPGVVRLVAHTETDTDAQLLTERVPGTSLADLDIASTASLAALGAAAAAVTADLHALGVSHGHLAPEHLIVSDGRVVLCSFGRAGEATPAATDRDIADLVVAITATARRMTEPSIRAERRHRRRLDELLLRAASRSLSATELAAALASLAADCGARGGGAGPGAAAAIDGTPVARDPGPSTGATPRPGHAAPPERPMPAPAAEPWRERVVGNGRDGSVTGADPPRRRRRHAMIGAAAGLIVVGLWFALAPDRRADTATVRPTTSVVAAPPTATPTPTTASPPPRASPGAPADEPRAIVIGNLVSYDGTWFEVGRAGDIVRVGDWDCDGSPSPAVLRPPTGEVFVFEGWVRGDDTRRVEALAVRPDATDIHSAPTPTCDALVIVDASGGESVVDIAS